MATGRRPPLPQYGEEAVKGPDKKTQRARNNPARQRGVWALGGLGLCLFMIIVLKKQHVHRPRVVEDPFAAAHSEVPAGVEATDYEMWAAAEEKHRKELALREEIRLLRESMGKAAVPTIEGGHPLPF